VIPSSSALYTGDVDDQDLLKRAVELPALSEVWKDHFRKRLSE
jgi:3-alpha domain